MFPNAAGVSCLHCPANWWAAPGTGGSKNSPYAVKSRGLENQGVRVFADSAYRSTEAEQMLCQKGYRSRIHEKAQRNRPLTKAPELANTQSRHDESGL
ncbi:transposase, degenerate [Acidithiobacillus ferrooxidans ATCC 23270]|uniref:Transposase, degenerate n=2 Tax=root TaxID=1 RepID=B7J8L2_ACIF2|nr:transposase, degenerate [Acidithiobacillus ferrooxidans ATCC 23270]